MAVTGVIMTGMAMIGVVMIGVVMAIVIVRRVIILMVVGMARPLVPARRAVSVRRHARPRSA